MPWITSLPSKSHVTWGGGGGTSYDGLSRGKPRLQVYETVGISLITYKEG